MCRVVKEASHSTQNYSLESWHWVPRANVYGALAIGNALWSLHLLTFSRGTETRSFITC